MVQAVAERSGLIDIDEVATIFGVTRWQARRYEEAAIVERVDRRRNKHLFDRPDVLWAFRRWEELRVEHSVAQAGRIIAEERRKRKRSHQAQS